MLAVKVCRQHCWSRDEQVSYKNLSERVLKLTVCDVDRLRRHNIIGSVVLRRHRRHCVTTSSVAQCHDVIDSTASRRHQQHRVTTSSTAQCHDVTDSTVLRRHRRHRVTTSSTAPCHDVNDADVSRRHRRYRVTTSSAASCFLFEDANTTWLYASCLPQCVLNALTPSLMPWVELSSLNSFSVVRSVLSSSFSWTERTTQLARTHFPRGQTVGQTYEKFGETKHHRSSGSVSKDIFTAWRYCKSQCVVVVLSVHPYVW